MTQYKSEKVITVFMVCTGLGHINRGYESCTRSCFNALINNKQFNIKLLKGAGPSTKSEITIPNLKRTQFLSKWLAKVIRRDSYYIEQLSFLIFMVPIVIFQKPNVIYISDFMLMCWLGHLKKILKLNYRILFVNGAPNGPPFSRADHVQQLLPNYFEIALKGGENPSKHSIVPHGIECDPIFIPIEPKGKKLLREKYGIPIGSKVLLSVGALNCHHKRMDYVVKEFAALKRDDVYLLLVGQVTEETPIIMDLAKKLLPASSYKILTVEKDQIKEIYSLADVFILASLIEGFGRVLLEALEFGLPILVHDFHVTREVLEKYGYFGDFTISGKLTESIMNNLDQKTPLYSPEEIHHYLYTKYSWNSLKDLYIEMFQKSLNG
jgi:glycosyltransferase involved in cell wall biosynthesis